MASISITPKIYLVNASITASQSSAISITGGANPTIYAYGDNNITSTAGYDSTSASRTYGAGIYVSEESSATITGSSLNDSLTVKGGESGAGIGGYHIYDSGNITIKNISLYSSAGEASYGDGYTGIGGYNKSGDITIENAKVYAYGSSTYLVSSSAIGVVSWVISSSTTIPNITIRDSVIYAYRSKANNGNSYSDHIGQGGSAYNSTIEYQAINGGIRVENVSITNSTIYCYKYDYNGNYPTEFEYTYVYDNSGTGTKIEQSEAT